MKFPEYESHAEQSFPTQGMIDALAEIEIGIRANDPGWSESLGAAFIHFSRGNRTKGKQIVTQVRKANGVAPIHAFLPSMLMFQNNPNQLQREQVNYHAAVIKELRTQLYPHKKYENEDNKANRAGFICELTTVGLLTRYAHPWLLATLTPPHLDRSDVRELNFDVCVSVNDDGQQTGHYLQVKKACSGRCGGHELTGEVNRYRSQIQIVSGCCDLGLFDANGNYSQRIPKALLAESRDGASYEEIKELDILSDTLLFNVTADLLPRGTAQHYQKL